ncbi:MAG: hypothetical protein QOD86_1173 [Miltoncostaeaceae bacterium]|jgi:hypothetical protein|nr:hypothetical protein [Miltoncostaeaceae bacterium]
MLAGELSLADDPELLADLARAQDRSSGTAAAPTPSPRCATACCASCWTRSANGRWPARPSAATTAPTEIDDRDRVEVPDR